MKKYFLLLLVGIASGITPVSAQVSEAVVDFNKTKRTVKSMEISDAPDIVEQAVKSKMLKWGYKPKETKGWMVFKDVDNPEISNERSDLYIKVERKSRKEKETSLVYFFASKPGEQATPVPFEGNMLSEDGFYSSVASYTVSERLEKDIRDQEEVAKKAQKKYDDLVKDQASLEKKIRNLQDELEDNKKKQEAQVTEIENQRKVLEQLKSKRNS
ncbi:hypothetical protein [Agriterribacter sp.]|uniref:hypothetical protein n=1 Tax=Agriterribacter sp. TaxID=2821509 RepID=UPI002C4B8957|nr:hypothetical protein [Agriterribacter sp.]HRP55078.1 hypothetical protein [Agriterribacter sp.]